MDREFVRGLLVEESFAYGFTIAFWGSGILIVNEYGLPHTPGVLAYAVGAVTGFGVLAVVTFGGAFRQVTPDRTPQYVLLAGIHYLASLVPIVFTHFVLIAPPGKFASLFLAGTGVSVVYNVSAALEETVSEWMLRHDPR